MPAPKKQQHHHPHIPHSGLLSGSFVLSFKYRAELDHKEKIIINQTVTGSKEENPVKLMSNLKVWTNILFRWEQAHVKETSIRSCTRDNKRAGEHVRSKINAGLCLVQGTCLTNESQKLCHSKVFL